MSLKIFENYELKKHSTFNIGGCAKRCFFPETEEEFLEILQNTENFIILGGASNVLISSYGIDEDIIFTTKLDKYEFNDNILTAQAGVKMPLLSRKAQELSFSGLEYAIGFPATVGGTVYMNAGAHGQETSLIFISAKVFDKKSKKIIILEKQDMNFAYRKSILQDNNYILIEAKFELTKKDKTFIDEKISSNLEFRKNKQPNLSQPNIGSIFKNPENNSAGKLLEEAGAKSFSVNGAKVYENHANFIINYNNATSSDVLKLMYKMQSEVNKKFGILLKSEIKYTGKLNEEDRKIWQSVSNQK